MKRRNLLLQVVVIAGLILSACAQTPTPTAAPTVELQPSATAALPEPTPTEAAPETLYVNLVWHQHQPLYYKDADGIYTRPWVRVHATKDYYDMASVVAEYPDVHVTFNITPVLIRQLTDFADNDAKDLYWVTAEKPANSLTDFDKRFILQRFFDANWTHIINNFPRYQELLEKRAGTDDAAIEAALASFTEQDYRDLQIWFNLGWFDPDFLAESPLKELVEKDRDFTEEDKQIVFDKVLEVIRGVLPLHKQLQDAGQIEVITTPYAHPILPLLIDSELALVGNPSGEVPARFQYPQDAVVHLEKSVEIYQENFGKTPAGLWPGEGSVAQAAVPYIIDAGYQWMATGEPVLAKSLGIDNFTRDGKETVKEADDLYRPYYVTDPDGNQLAVFFRDGVLSDKIGFTYSSMTGKAAAADMMQRLEDIRAKLAEQNAAGPHVVSIILDGENAWENYDNDGKEFFHSFYHMLSDSETIQTITPSEYLKLYPEQRTIENLYPAAWFSPNYDTWIGEAEETTAWNYLGLTRGFLEAYAGDTSPEAVAQAQDFMYLAEGSDWFWWYGSDQDSGQDSYFDQGYRALLRGVYESLGEPVPSFVDVPIIQAQPVSADTPLNGLSTPTIDGKADDGEWAKAAVYTQEDGTPLAGFEVTLDNENLYIKANAAQNAAMPAKVGIYVLSPKTAYPNSFTVAAEGEKAALLNFAVSYAFLWDGGDTLAAYAAGADGWRSADTAAVGSAAASGKVLETAIPLSIFGKLGSGDDLRLAVVAQPANQVIPAGGPGQVVLSALDTSTVVFEVIDPEGDDYGPGTYTYPTDGVFKDDKSYDLQSFRVSVDDTSILFKFAFYGAVANSWGSPNGLAIQTLDVYVDKDPGAGTGARMLFPGRNAALEEGSGWDVGIWAEGWTPKVVYPDPQTLEPKADTEASFKVVVDASAQTVTLIVPKEAFGEGDPAAWGYAAVVLGQEGYPNPPEVWRVRNIASSSAQWAFGGAPSDANHTRIIDLIWPADGDGGQEAMLSNYVGNNKPMAELTADDVAQLKLLLVQ